MARRPLKKRGTSSSSAGQSRFYRGEQGVRHAEQVKEQQDRRREQAGNKVWRFYVPVGETKEMIILDDKPDFFMWEHNYKENGKYGNLSSCCKEWETCPTCEKYPDSESYFGMFLTVLDLTEFTDKSGNDHEFSRKLCLVKPSQHKKFTRLHERHGTLRGMRLEMARDGEKDSAIGNDIEFIEMVPEDELGEYVREWTDREGKVHEEDCSVPYVYEDIFVEPTPENIAAQIGVIYEPSPGSAKSNRRALEEDDEDMDDEDEGEERPRRRKPAKAGRRAGATKRRAVDDGDDDPWDEEEEEGEDSETEEDERPARRTVMKKRRSLRKR